MKKSQIRKTFSSQRKQISISEAEVLSAKLLNQFQKLDFSQINVVHIFLPITEKREPDTFLFIDWLQKNHPTIKIIVPKADFKTSLMTHHVYPGREGLQKNLFHILEPVDSMHYTGQVDLVVIPMLAFDRKGYRVGYGKGFYDRFLEGLDAYKVGICFYPPLDAIEDVDSYDIRLDICLTPEETFKF